MHITSVGIDLGKTTFHLVALDTRGQVVVKKKFSRPQLLVYMANLKGDAGGHGSLCRSPLHWGGTA